MNQSKDFAYRMGIHATCSQFHHRARVHINLHSFFVAGLGKFTFLFSLCCVRKGDNKENLEFMSRIWLNDFKIAAL